MAHLRLFEHGPTAQLRHDGAAWVVPDAAGSGRLSDEQLALIEEAAELQGGKRALRISRRGAVRAGGTVGVIGVPGATVEILPKIDATHDKADLARGNLLEFLTFSGSLPAEVDPGALQDLRRLPLYETLIRLFADSTLAALRRGPRAEYRRVSENLSVLRGRIDFRQQVRQNLVRPHRLACRYEAHTVDHPAHRVLRWTAAMAWRSSRLPESRKRLMEVERLLSGVEVVRCSASDCDRLNFTRLTRHLKVPTLWARVLLGSRRPRLAAGDTDTFSLLFDLARVYEAYVAALASCYLRGDVRRIWSQRSIGHLWHPSRGKAAVAQKPDLRLKLRDGRTVIVDTKYKHAGGLREGDLRQMLAYIQLERWRRRDRETGAMPDDIGALLLHPCVGKPPPAQRGTLLRPADDGPPLRVTHGAINLGRAIQGIDDRLAVVDELRELLGLVVEAKEGAA